MAITLQSTIGGFSDEFMRRLPKLEQAIIDNGLDPAEFVISKDRATPATVPLLGPFFYEYTVFFGDEKFTVTEPNDMKFLEYFYQRCIAPDDPTPGAGATRAATRTDQPHLPLDGPADLNTIPPTPAPASPVRSPRNSGHP
jgi:hypothetical protein